MKTSTAGIGPTESEPTLSRWNVGPVLAAGIFMVISLFGVTLGGPAASSTPLCLDQSSPATIAASVATHQSGDQVPECDEVSQQPLNEQALDRSVASAPPTTTGSPIGLIMFSVLAGLILLSLATDRELPAHAQL